MNSDDQAFLKGNSLRHITLMSNLIELRIALESLWCAETAVDGTFTAQRGSRGQCVPTALLVNELYGGDILRTVVLGESHYFNRVNGTEIDLTRDQFPVWIGEMPTVRLREEILENESSRRRCELLHERYFASLGL
jgi:hypothetical protein